MTTQGTQRNPLQRDGLTQAGRSGPALDPAHAPVADRNLTEQLAFAWRYSRHLRYYEADGSGDGGEVRENGRWQEILRYEPIFFLAVMGSASPVPFRRAFESALSAVDFQTPDPAAWQAAMKPVFGAIYDVFEQAATWQRTAAVESSAGELLRNFGRERFSRQVVLLLSLHQTAFSTPNPLIGRARSDLSDWGIDFSKVTDFGFDESQLRDKIARELRSLSTQVLDTFSSLLASARDRITADLDAADHSPHIGLFLTFLDLLGYSRDRLNRFTRRHLDFYLKELLRLEKRDPEPDHAHLIFSLAKRFEAHRLEAGKEFKAGKDSLGKELIYRLTEELVVNRASVAALKSRFCEVRDAAGGGVIVDAVRYAPAADSRNGLGEEPLPEDDPKWPPFGAASLPYAPLGMALVSPLFRLAEGDRTLRVILELKDAAPFLEAFGSAGEGGTDGKRDLPDLFRAELSTGKKWHDVTPEMTVDPATDEVIVTIRLDVAAPPIADPTPELPETAGLAVDAPILKLYVNQETENAYDVLRRAAVDAIRLETEVNGVRNLVLQNDLGVLKPAKPFMPFGPQAPLGASFYIGCREAFAKPLKQVDLSWDWVNPPADLETHYQSYADQTFRYRVDAEILLDYEWQLLEDGVPISIEAEPGGNKAMAMLAPQEMIELDMAIREMPSETLRKADYDVDKLPGGFKTAFTQGQQAAMKRLMGEARNKAFIGTGKKAGRAGLKGRGTDYLKPTAEAALRPEPKLKPELRPDLKPAAAGSTGDQFIDQLSFPIGNYPPDSDAPAFKSFEVDLPRGGIRLSLTSPDFAFGHADYPQLHTRAVAEAFKENGSTTDLDALHPPYTPQFENIRLDYVAATRIDLAADPTAGVLYHLHPFGVSAMGERVVPDCTDEGTFYIGIADLDPPQTLSLLFQFAEGSGDPFVAIPGSVAWSYLADDGWHPFDTADILKDDTDGFLQSGIVRFAVPEGASDDNPLMPTGRHWIRLVVDRRTASLHDLLSVRAQAGTARFEDRENAADHLESALPAGIIAKAVQRDPAVKSIAQPYASEGGRPRESDPAFYTRVSERLRHKGVVSTMWDYEHLILETFPDLHKVKCLNHTSPDSERRPGHVTVVVIPDLRNKNNPYPLRPAVDNSRLQEIKTFLLSRSSPFVRPETLHVQNPSYERIRVGGKVIFRKGYDEGLYRKQLHEDITAGLTPWLTGGGEIAFAGRIHRSVILNLIEELPYVDYLPEFRVDHIVDDDDIRRDVDEVAATRSHAILVSADAHDIEGEAP